jgi:GR25 family glycosyltransferase involved in LPS biosynthesis
MDGQELLMDKNKSAFKLKNLPHIYWLNLDSDVERRKYMETQFRYWEIEKHTRISGYDARGDNDVSCNLKGIIPDNVNQNELGCCMSHLKAIKHFYEETDDEYCIIVEDDVNLDIAKYWNFTWTDFFSLLPYDWDCVQLTTICTGDIHVKLHLKFINDFSAAIYLISRHHASKMMKHHIRGNKFKLDNGVKPRAVSEDTILESGKTYTIPLFLYNLEFDSTIHPEHINVFHKAPHDALLNWWQQSGAGVDIKDHMNYDPYLGRITEPSQKHEENPPS